VAKLRKLLPKGVAKEIRVFSASGKVIKSRRWRVKHPRPVRPTRRVK